MHQTYVRLRFTNRTLYYDFIDSSLIESYQSLLGRHIKIERLDAASPLWFSTRDVDFCSSCSPSFKNRTVSLAQLAGSPYSQGRL
jgi:hypothetical protein